MCCYAYPFVGARNVFEKSPQPVSCHFTRDRNLRPASSWCRVRQKWSVWPGVQLSLVPDLKPLLDPPILSEAFGRDDDWQQTCSLLKCSPWFASFCSTLQISMFRSHGNFKLHWWNGHGIRKSQPSKNQQGKTQQLSCHMPFCRSVAHTVPNMQSVLPSMEVSARASVSWCSARPQIPWFGRTAKCSQHSRVQARVLQRQPKWWRILGTKEPNLHSSETDMPCVHIWETVRVQHLWHTVHNEWLGSLYCEESPLPSLPSNLWWSRQCRSSKSWWDPAQVSGVTHSTHLDAQGSAQSTSCMQLCVRMKSVAATSVHLSFSSVSAQHLQNCYISLQGCRSHQC